MRTRTSVALCALLLIAPLTGAGNAQEPAGQTSAPTGGEARTPVGHAVTVWTNPATGLKAAENTQDAQHVYHWHTTALDPTVGASPKPLRRIRRRSSLRLTNSSTLPRGNSPISADLLHTRNHPPRFHPVLRSPWS